MKNFLLFFLFSLTASAVKVYAWKATSILFEKLNAQLFNITSAYSNQHYGKPIIDLQFITLQKSNTYSSTMQNQCVINAGSGNLTFSRLSNVICAIIKSGSHSWSFSFLIFIATFFKY
jgi:hypothetical protein